MSPATPPTTATLSSNGSSPPWNDSRTILALDVSCPSLATSRSARSSTTTTASPRHRGDLVQETRALDSRASGVALPLRSQVLLYALARHSYPLLSGNRTSAFYPRSSVTIILRRRAATRFLDLFGSSDYSRVTFVGSPRRAGPFVSLASGLGAPAPGRPCGSHSGPATSCGSHDICRRGRGGDDGSPHRW